MPDRIEVRAVRTGGRDFMEVPTADEAQAAALLRERAGYVARRLPARVAEVDAELQRLGVPVPADTKETSPDDRDERRSRRAARQPAGRRAAAERR